MTATVYEADWICPAGAPVIRDGAIRIEQGRIAAVGRAQEIAGARRFRFSHCAITPGFVNVHSHLELTILRGFLENRAFVDWILGLVRAKYQSLSRDALKASAQLGAIEMLQAGVTAVGEVMDVGAAWEAMAEFGLQGVAYQEVFGPEDSVAAESMAALQGKIARFRSDETATFRIGVSPHAPYTVSRTLYEAARDYARSESLPLTAHIAESRDEAAFVRDGAGPFGDGQRNRGIKVTPRHATPVGYLDSMALLGPDMLLIHAIEIDDADMERIRASGAAVAHCPKSNAKLGHRTAPIAEMIRQGVRVGLGTDSMASNNVVDMFEEMRAAVLHQRTRTGRVDALTAQDAFRMATIEAAQCLGLADQIGSLEPGKRADFAVVDLGSPATQPVYDPVETMVYSASRRDIRAVFMGGREVELDSTAVLQEAATLAGRLLTGL